MSYEELIKDEDYDEKDAMIIHLQNKIDNLNEKLEDYEWMVDELKKAIERDIETNKRCFVEEVDKYVKKTLKLWDGYDRKLLEIISEDNQ